MGLRFNKRIWLLLPILMVLLASAVLWHIRSGLADSTVCPDNWYASTDPVVLQACSDQKAARHTSDVQQADATAQAQPYVQTIPNSAPVRLLPQPDDTKQIVERPLVPSNPADLQGLPFVLENATSWWEAGSAPNADYTSWDPVSVLTHPGNGATYVSGGATSDTFIVNTNPTLTTSVEDGDVYQRQTYGHIWVCPQPVGALYITNIVAGTSPGLGADGANFSGLNYIVYFKTTSGKTGTFNMANQTWTFDP